MPNNSPSLDEVFHSLSDPTRRSVLERLTSGPATVSQLAQEFPISLAVVPANPVSSEA
jgi:DNA-binding transcriptional ArsR family regulator